MKVERAMAEAQREDPDVIPRLKTKVEALEAAQKRLAEIEGSPGLHSVSLQEQKS